ncbi:Kdo(2)-lipid IV(A) acyltransferase [Proteus terrae]|uniref:Lipid A biosynthesis acyltransferase n=1 Tax=Proteus terrae subsp. cibarius TaxID=626774 RepID=A0A8I0WWW6_9GAMM|nr:Kdo(2)-lipid IV(A) acyltransferase [Proteus terrae]MBG2916227.1 LpxL/LpxP family Kdo(2)-lipid IV(A) lauroyl/palmitoleoyl acyltransferasee [Proteus terrae subsp. cibarius]MCO4179136.1 LpxL/LpxP family Kdo(2)-lipid IV(A) lauroyl/palmitoleoyl acyltransferasee [Proteus terrae]MCO4188133.1 LpxL/LpxP family Kdo(2)-lipid IV(A) lauroyl/palmitoleoyl acyltransferasee [Proteus terrae]QHD96082.1 LpxL/LpxP family Kdo(2)-lipid IV(A) lauroyl/palmitoleoyl acyltransferase [Proteus terrae subsp. cibarius]QJW
MIKSPPFKKSFLQPKYWLTWFGIGLLYILVLLPYPVIYWLGTRLGRFSKVFLKKRVQIAERNLELCFPQMPKSQREALVNKNFESVGMGLFETGMAWFWPEWRVKRWFKVSGLENVSMIQEKGQGILLIGIHFLTLELGARIFGIYTPGVGVYRPNDNPVMDWLQTWGRLRSNKFMIDRKDVKGMIRSLKAGEIVWYAPDHDYGPRKSVFVPLFAVDKAATTTGTYILARTSNPALIPFTPKRLPEGKGYELIISPPVADFPVDNEENAAKAMNKVVEQEILRAPDQYMWLHRRFKTRPEGDASLYNEIKKVH